MKVSSSPEVFLSAIAAANLPQPVAEYCFGEGPWAKRKWRFDWAWPEHRVALEVQGGGFRMRTIVCKRCKFPTKVRAEGAHTSGKALRRDCEKFSAAAVLGWRLLLRLPEDLATVETLELLEAALARN